MQVVPSGGQICNQCKWRHLVAKIGTNACDAIWWTILQLMQIAPSQVIDSIPWVRCASGNVFVLRAKIENWFRFSLLFGNGCLSYSSVISSLLLHVTKRYFEDKNVSIIQSQNHFIDVCMWQKYTLRTKTYFEDKNILWGQKYTFGTKISLLCSLTISSLVFACDLKIHCRQNVSIM